MVLPILTYGHPMLRQKGALIEEITPDIQTLVSDMMETMEENHGVGLAAQQIGQALQLTVVDVRAVTERPSWAEVSGERVELDALMPLTLINPKLTLSGEWETGPEGCLSFPEIYADVSRPVVVDVESLDAKGEPVAFRCGGLLARAIQHEVDHLNGVLFIDRMSSPTKSEVQPELDDLQAETKALLQEGG